MGVIRALIEAGIPIDMIGGTSIGAFMAALYAEERSYNQMRIKAQQWCMVSDGNVALPSSDGVRELHHPPGRAAGHEQPPRGRAAVGPLLSLWPKGQGGHWGRTPRWCKCGVMLFRCVRPCLFYLLFLCAGICFFSNSRQMCFSFV